MARFQPGSIAGDLDHVVNGNAGSFVARGLAHGGSIPAARFLHLTLSLFWPLWPRLHGRENVTVPAVQNRKPC